MTSEVGSIIGYLKLDRSDWDAELNAAGRKADDLARHNPNIKIGTNAPSAIAQLAAVAAAVKRLQDAQGAETVAERKLTDLRNSGNASAGKLAAAEENVAKARRNVAAATIALAAAHDRNDTATRRAITDTDKLAKTADKTAASFKVGLIPALLAVAPAAVPIAGVAGGALLGLLPVAATVALGIKGIGNQMKAGALQGTQFAASVDSLKSEMTTLQQAAAGGLISGINQALAASGPLFKTVNQDVAVMGGQLGDIVAGAAPALLTILTQLNPLFVTFGQLLTGGAQRLEHWATSSTGVQSFVAYVQAELPDVVRFLGEVITLFGHLAEAAAPFGGVLLTDITALIDALNKIPIGVLSAAIPLAVSLYAALKAYQGITVVLRGVSKAMDSMKASSAASAAAQEAAQLRTQAAYLASEASAKRDAAEVAASEAQKAAAAEAAASALAASSGEIASLFANEARAADEAAAQIAAAFEGMDSLFATQAEVAAASAASVAAAMQAEADAAAAAAAEISASAEAAAEAASAAGEASSAGWASMLGPIGAVAVGIAILSTAFHSNSQEAQQNQQAINSFTQALEQSKGAIDSTVQAKIAQSLVDQKAIDNAKILGVNTTTLVAAVLGNVDAQKQLNAVYDKAYQGSLKQQNAAADLSRAVNTLIPQFAAARKTATQYLTTIEQSAGITDRAAVSAAALYHLHGTDGVAAYLAAKQAADKNTDSTKQQTLAFQMENNAAALVNQALQSLAGQNLSNAQAQTAMKQATLNAIAALKTNKGALDQHTQAGLNDRQAIEGAVSAIQAKMTAEAQATGSTEKATTQYHSNAKALLEQIGKLDGTKSAAYRYAQQLLKIPPVVKTKADLETDQAKAAARAYIRWLRSLPTVTIGVNFAANRKSTYNSQVPGHYASGTDTGGLPDGWAWVGDPGPASELVHKQGPHVDVYSHDESVQIAGGMGMQVPAYAKGTKKPTHPTAAQANRVDTSSTTLLQVAATLSDSYSQVRSAADSLRSAAISAHLSAAALRAVSHDQSRLLADSKRRDVLNARLASAESRLKAEQQQYASDKSKYAGAVSGAFDITGVTPPTPMPTTTTSTVAGSTIATTAPAGAAGVLTAAQILTADQADVNQAKAFDAALHKLIAEGMNADDVAAIAAKGPDALPTAQALAKATPAQIRKLNSLDRQRASAANDVGTLLAKRFDGAGVAAAQGLVNGLKSQEKALTAQMRKLADAMVDEIKHKLKIHSPSLVMHELGEHIAGGLANGMQAKLPMVRSAARGMAGATVPARWPGAPTGAASGGHTVVTNIYPRANQSEMEIGKQAGAEQAWALAR